MFCITDFCHICLKCDNTLTNVISKNPENALIVSKLNNCVSEVQWALNEKLIICKSCVEKLDSAYNFKQQCIKSTHKLNEYITRLNKETSATVQASLKVALLENVINKESLDEYAKSHIENPQILTQIISEGNLISPVTQLILSNPNCSTLSSVYLNFIPTTCVNLNPQLNTPAEENSVSPEVIDNTSVSQIIDNNNLEELSVDVDPYIFNILSDDESDFYDVKDLKYDENVNTFVTQACLDTFNVSNEEITEIGGHFLIDLDTCVTCLACKNTFETLKSLQDHIKDVHDGNFPFSCNYCTAEFALREDFESHVKKHSNYNSEILIDNSITLQNLSNIEYSLSTENSLGMNCNEEYKCETCPRTFLTSMGLLRHKVKWHNFHDEDETHQAKYFIKGTKHARCLICNSCFSTSSYLNVHIKSHNRKGEWTSADYKSKIKDDQKVRKRKTVQSIETKPVTDRNEQMEFAGTPSVQENDKECVPLNENKGLKIKINLKDLHYKENVQNEVTLKDENNINSECEQNCNVQIKEKMQIDEQIDKNQDTDEIMNNTDEIMNNTDTSPSEEDSILQNPNATMFAIDFVNGKPVCVYCNKKFGRKHDLKRHLNNVHMKSIQYKCHLCKKKFYEGFHLTRHLRSHYCSMTCSHCDKKFSAITDVKNHVLNSHDAVTKINCEVCNISLDDLDVLKEHVDEHMKTVVYKCHLCDEEYRECRDLTKHLVEHSGMYTCNTCNRTFSTEKDLTSHFKTKFKCSICQHTFKKRPYLYSHLKTQHSKGRHDVEILIDKSTCW